MGLDKKQFWPPTEILSHITYAVVYPGVIRSSQVLINARELDVCHEVSRVRRRLSIVQEATWCYEVVYKNHGIASQRDIPEGVRSQILDGQSSSFNGTSAWLVSNALLFYRDGLDESSTHNLTIVNSGGGSSNFSLWSVAVYQFSQDSAVLPPA